MSGFFDGLDMDPKVKQWLEDLMKLAAPGVMDKQKEFDFMKKTLLEFDTFYGNPSETFKGVCKLQTFLMCSIIRNSTVEHDDSELLRLVSIIQPLQLYLRELSKGMGTVSEIVDVTIDAFLKAHPEVMTEAKQRFEKMSVDNAEFKKKFEATGGAI